jgi:hypothetical protein
MVTALSLMGFAAAACGGGDEGGSAGDGDNSTGDGDGDTDSGDGDSMQSMGGSSGGVTCDIEERANGNVVVSCSDGMETVVEPSTPPAVDCSSDKNADGTTSVTCGEQDPIIVGSPTVGPASLVVQEGDRYVLVSVNDGEVTRTPLWGSELEGTPGGFLYEEGDDEFLFIFQHDDGGEWALHSIDMSGSEPGKQEQLLGATAGGQIFQMSRVTGGVMLWGDLYEDDKLEVIFVSLEADDFGTPSNISPLGLPADRDIGFISLAQDWRSMAYTSNESSDMTNEVFYVDLTEQPFAPLIANGTLVDEGEVSIHALLGETGDHLLYLADAQTNDVVEAYIVDVADGTPGSAKKVNGDLAGEEILNITVSPDGNWVALNISNNGGSEIQLVDVTGGSVQSRGTVLASETATLSTIGGSFAFTPDSGSFIFAGDYTTDDSVELYAVDLSVGDPQSATTLNAAFGYDRNVSQIVHSPSGRWLAYTANPDGIDDTELFAVRTNGSKHTRLNPDFPDNGASVRQVADISFASQVDHLVFSTVTDDTLHAAYTVDLTGNNAGDAMEVFTFETPNNVSKQGCNYSPAADYLACFHSGTGLNIVESDAGTLSVSTSGTYSFIE